MLLKLAIQKSGRLHDDSVKLLKECGIELNNGNRQLKVRAANFPAEAYFFRDDDIPQYVSDNVADVGIVGENVVFEKEKELQVVSKLGFGRCRLSIAVPKNMDYKNPQDLNGLKIATSYTVLLQKFLDKNNIQAEIHEISGSVEIAPSIGLADAVCDLVSSGSTLFTNGLREVETVMKSEAVLIARKNLSEDFQKILEKILFRLRAVNAATQNKYILLNAPNEKLKEIISLLPGIKSPTVMPLAEKNWSSIHSVINENDFWEVVESLKRAGAEGILVLSIDQMIQ